MPVCSGVWFLISLCYFPKAFQISWHRIIVSVGCKHDNSLPVISSYLLKNFLALSVNSTAAFRGTYFLFPPKVCIFFVTEKFRSSKGLSWTIRSGKRLDFSDDDEHGNIDTRWTLRAAICRRLVSCQKVWVLSLWYITVRYETETTTLLPTKKIKNKNKKQYSYAPVIRDKRRDYRSFTR